MSDANDNEGRPNSGNRTPLTLKPRPGGSVSAGTVKQSFSHGRSKTVVVETKRRRFEAPAPAPAKPQQAFDVKRPAPGASQGGQSRPSPANASADGLSSEEAARRARAVEAARQESERREAARRESEVRAAADAARQQAEARAEASARAEREQAQAPSAQAPSAQAAPPQAEAPQAAAPPAQAPQPAADAPTAQAPQAAAQPAAEVPRAQAAAPEPTSAPAQTSEAPQAPAPQSAAPQVATPQSAATQSAPTQAAAPRPAAPTARAEPPRPVRSTPGERVGGYRPTPRADQQRPRTDSPREPVRGGTSGGDPRRDDRQSGYTFRQGPRPQGAGAAGATDRPRDGQRPYGDRTGAPREAQRPGGGDRGPRPSGDTVRYSALNPRPAAPRGPRPGAGPGAGANAPPAQPEFTRAARQAPRPGAANLDRRPDDDDRRSGGAKTAAPGKAVSRTKGEPKRREGRLTIQAVAGDEDSAERMRSLASVRRAREREREKRKGSGVDQAKIAREVVIPDVITVQELAQRMATRSVDVIKFLMREGLMLKINDVIDNDTAELVATEFGHTVRRVSESDVEEGFLAAEDMEGHMLPRPPVVTVMGHVDHGKTSLLDALRSTDVAAGEHGGITQHIGAYQVRLADGARVTFLDTPGHAAFSSMRARGANITDIVVLVVAADDGVMPQTIEAIQHAKAAGAPIIVAINKIDKAGAKPERVINELLQHEIVVESLGGDTQAIEVSATQRLGLDDLVEAISLQAEVLDLRANPDRSAEGVVIEAKLDKGRGPVATVLVKRGTLKRGDIVVAGSAWGRVRALVDERSEQLPEAGPSVPVEILGLSEAPSPGDAFAVVENDARARELTEYRERKRREGAIAPAAAGGSLAEMMAKLQSKTVRELPVIIKADVQGSAEAIVGSLDKLSTDEVRARIISSGAGAITESDVTLAKGSGAPILGFNVRASKQARDLAEREGVEIRYYSIIYDLLDDIKGVLSGMLAPLQRETFLGNANVLQAFDISKVGKVAGCRVTEGVVRRGAKVRIVRENIVVLELGTLQTLKRFKDDVAEVTSGYECGMQFAGFQDIRPGDVIECFTIETVARTL